MPFQIGDQAGDYQVLAVLGAGGMGQVYKVRNLISDRIEAMKVLLPNLEADPELGDRFLREIKVQAALVHPNIASLYTAQRLDNQLVMIMEFVEGTSLEKLLERGPVPMATGVDCICQVLSALAYAHSHGVIHRDIKPPNIMLTGSGQVKLMDFGIAKVAADKRLTQTGRTVGSLYYMSPEQIKGASELDPRADLYSLGVTLYETVTGKRPFQGDSDYSIMAAHLSQNPVPPIELDPRIPSALNEIILMSIARDPVRRFQSADAFRAALESVAPLMALPAPAADKTRMYTEHRMPTPPPAAPSAPEPVAQPAPVVPPAQPATGSSSTAPAARSSGRRGLYMALGAVAALAVLAVAVTQAPRFLHTQAQNGVVTEPLSKPLATTTAPQTTAPETTAPQTTAPQTSAPQTTSTTPPAPTAAPASQPFEQPRTATPQPLPVEPRHTVARQTAAPSTPPPAQQTAVQPATQAVASPPQSQPRPVSAPPPPQNVTPAEDPAHTRALAELRDRYNGIAIRAGSIKSSMRRLEEANARSGMGIRGDMQNAASRLDYLMQEATSSLRGGDVEAAARSLDSAETALETLERWLNH